MVSESKNVIESSYKNPNFKGEKVENKPNKNAKLWNQVNKANITKTATQQEFNDFIDKAWSNNKELYKEMPNAIKVATLDKDLMKALSLENGDTYLTKSQAIHTRQSRKEKFNQDIPRDEYNTIPQVISKTKRAFIDIDDRLVLPFKSKEKGKINIIIIEPDTQGNLMITTKKINLDDLGQFKKADVSAVGVEPTIQTTPKAKSLYYHIDNTSTDNKVDSTKNVENMQDSKKDSKIDFIDTSNKDLPINRR